MSKKITIYRKNFLSHISDEIRLQQLYERKINMFEFFEKNRQNCYFCIITLYPNKLHKNVKNKKGHNLIFYKLFNTVQMYNAIY